MKIILPLNEVPSGAQVTLVKGTKRYTKIESIVVHYPSGVDVLAEAKEGTCFLLGEQKTKIASLSAYPGDKEVIWYTTHTEYMNYIENQRSHK